MKRSEINDLRQAALGIDLSDRECPDHNLTEQVGYIEFYNPPPQRLFVGSAPLDKYLVDHKMAWVLRLREFLSGLNWSLFAAAYTGMGRKPSHPMALIGLIIYGMIEGKSSLRELERMAVRDLGAWWLCGGLQPDHSTIGKFINLHMDIITEEFFIELTREICKQLNLKASDVSGDGTVIESAGSRFKVIKEEAARQAAKEARERAEKYPKSAEAEQAAEQAEQVLEHIKQRQEKAKENGNGKTPARICATDPEAVIQKQKKSGNSASYKPSVLADDNRIILGQTVHPSNENTAVKPMICQYDRILGALPERMMLDAGYFNFEMLDLSIDLDLDLLCPSGRTVDGSMEKKSCKGKFIKQDFVYDKSANVYICPVGKELPPIRNGNEKGLSYTLYRCKCCADCESREKCTESKQGRSVKRYEKDELKEAMTEVMKQKGARTAYKKRQGMVEPVFSMLRGSQGLNRFRRIGLKKVKLEFSLHCIAYNVGRLLRLEQSFRCIGAYLRLEWRNERWTLHLACITILVITNFDNSVSSSMRHPPLPVCAQHARSIP